MIPQSDNSMVFLWETLRLCLTRDEEHRELNSDCSTGNELDCLIPDGSGSGSRVNQSGNRSEL